MPDYFMLAYGILDPTRLRFPLTHDEFNLRVHEFCRKADVEHIQTVCTVPYLAIPVSDTLNLTTTTLSVQQLGGPIQATDYAMPLQAFPQALMNALGPKRDAVEVQWTRVQYLASQENIMLPNGQWLWLCQSYVAPT